MFRVFIVSPDPDTRRTLEIVFELNGFSVNSGINVNLKSLEDTDAIIVDIIADNAEEWRMAAKVPKKYSNKLALILPRGAKTAKTANATLVIKRPFELMDVVKRVKSAVITHHYS